MKGKYKNCPILCCYILCKAFRKCLFKELWNTATNVLYLITVACKTAALHGTRIKVTLVVKLEDRQTGMNVVKNWWQPTSESKQLCSIAVKPHTHGTLKRQIPTITEQGTRKQETRQNQMGYHNLTIVKHASLLSKHGINSLLSLTLHYQKNGIKEHLREEECPHTGP